MNKKTIDVIERIISRLNEMDILTKNRDCNYFYNGYEMPILCGLVNGVDDDLNIVSKKIKQKYSNVKWNIVEVHNYHLIK